MTSRLGRLPYRVCCGLCGTTVEPREARRLDICGPVYVCSRCTELYTRWPSWPETILEEKGQARVLEPERACSLLLIPESDRGPAGVPTAGAGPGHSRHRRARLSDSCRAQ